MEPLVLIRGFIDFDKDSLPDHELDLFLPRPGSSVASLNELVGLKQMGPLPSNLVDEERRLKIFLHSLRKIHVWKNRKHLLKHWSQNLLLHLQ